MHPPTAVPPAPVSPDPVPGPPAPAGSVNVEGSLKSRLTRWAAGLFIGGYLSVLAVGVASHAVGYGQGSHPIMYYVVWDMFCGWSAQSYRTHVLAEGESGTWYDVGTGPWDDGRPFRPYGELKRVHYDVDATHAASLGMNVLRHTAHEPIMRIAVVEECWAKKYNMPEPYWSARWNVPKDPASYFAVRHTLTADGQLLGSKPGWAAEVTRRSVQSSEKIRRIASRPGRLTSPVRQASYESATASNALTPDYKTDAADDLSAEDVFRPSLVADLND